MDSRELIRQVPTTLFLGGEQRDAENGATFTVFDPSTGEALTEVADASPADAMKALDAAVAVQSEWAATPARARGELLRAVFDRIIERADDFALLMTLEWARPYRRARRR